jgi:hypothetical protein
MNLEAIYTAEKVSFAPLANTPDLHQLFRFRGPDEGAG